MDLGWIVFFEAALINIFLMAILMSYTSPHIGWLAIPAAIVLIIVSILLIKIAKSATKPSAYTVSPSA